MELTLTTRTIERFYEIAFVNILQNLGKDMPNEKIDYFLEHFCKMYDIDFTSISLIKNMYAKKMRPNKKEISIFTKAMNIPRFKLPIDYRTYSKYIKNWFLNKEVELNPHIVNAFLKPALKKFVESFVGLMHNDLEYIKKVVEVKPNDEADKS
jgi:hypothetical protein